MSPQERLAEVETLISVAGGTVTSVTPLADPDDPHTIVAHQVHTSSPTVDVHAQVTAILADHAVDTSGLVPWVDPDAIIEEVELP
ncbi:hypothetical protein [uncultured Aeromicrobium sp.]|uniref:hypothetical protein n=1 Tax=uncultured Aeromicrobium sp. TaxID=337820 RepID=UPI0025E402C1|nr:hypothetical protein [uncultured Aeromicrobium sp.]